MATLEELNRRFTSPRGSVEQFSGSGVPLTGVFKGGEYYGTQAERALGAHEADRAAMETALGQMSPQAAEAARTRLAGSSPGLMADMSAADFKKTGGFTSPGAIAIQARHAKAAGIDRGQTEFERARAQALAAAKEYREKPIELKGTISLAGPLPGAEVEPKFEDVRKRFIGEAPALPLRERALAEVERTGTIGGALSPRGLAGLTGQVSAEEQRAKIQALSGNPAVRKRGAATLANIEREKKAAEAKETMLAGQKQTEATLTEAGFPAGVSKIIEKYGVDAVKAMSSPVTAGINQETRLLAEGVKSAATKGLEKEKFQNQVKLAGLKFSQGLLEAKAKGLMPGTPEYDAVLAVRLQEAKNQGAIRDESKWAAISGQLMAQLLKDPFLETNEEKVKALEAFMQQSDRISGEFKAKGMQAEAPTTVGEIEAPAIPKAPTTKQPQQTTDDFMAGGADDERRLNEIDQRIEDPDGFGIDRNTPEGQKLYNDLQTTKIRIEERQKIRRKIIADQEKAKVGLGG